MKRILFILLILATASLFVISCNTHVRPFPQELTVYFPYTEGQELVFNDEDGHEMRSTVKEVFVSQEGSYCGKCGWWPYMRFSTNTGFVGGMTADRNLLYIEAYFLSNEPFEKEIHCHPYASNVISVIGDTIALSNSVGCELFIVKDRGIVKYTDNTVTWSLVE